jgi:hypothetical protein
MGRNRWMQRRLRKEYFESMLRSHPESIREEESQRKEAE